MQLVACLQTAFTFPCAWDEPVTQYVSAEHFNSSGSQKGLATVAPLSNCTWLVIRWSRCTEYVAVLGIHNLHRHSLQGKNPNNPRGELNRKKKNNTVILSRFSCFSYCPFILCWMTQRELAHWWVISFRFVPYWLLQWYRENNLIPWM